MRKQKYEEIEGVIVGSWRGVEKYSCRICAYDTLEKAKFIYHFSNMHPPLEVIDGVPLPPEPEAPPLEVASEGDE